MREKLETLNGFHSNAAGFRRWLEARFVGPALRRSRRSRQAGVPIRPAFPSGEHSLAEVPQAEREEQHAETHQHRVDHIQVHVVAL